MSNHAPFQRLSVHQFHSELLDLLRDIACKTGRIEIVGDNGQCDCVLISKKELDGLERALDVLAETHEVKALCDHIAQFAQMDNELDNEMPAEPVRIE